MTTVVYNYKQGLIAIDSRITSRDVIVSDEFDKHLSQDSEKWFFCGTVADSKHLMQLKHDEKPEVKPDSTAIVACDGEVKLVTFNGDHCSHETLKYNFAIGSGANFAISALDFNSDVKSAVEYAAKKDPFTGGKIQVFDVNKMEFIAE